MPPPLMHPRRKLSNKFPDTDLGKSLRKPFKIRGLYSPIEQIFDIIHLDVLHCKDKFKDVVLTLHANGFLGRKVFNVWGTFSMNLAIWIKLNNVFIHYYFNFICSSLICFSQ